MAQIVEEIGCLLDYLATDPQRLGSFGSPICLSGHSAGGHLTALHRGHAAVTYAMAISALTELEPISLCWLNDLLQLTPKEIAAYSPVRHIGAGVPMIVAVGAAELPELVRQSDEYAAACQWAGEDVTHIHVPGCTHFSILEDLAQPDGLLMKTLMQRLFTLNR